MLTSLAVALLLAPAAPVPVKVPRKLEPPVIKVVVAATGQVAFEVTNPNAVPLPYMGYTANSISPPLTAGRIAPLCTTEVRKAKVWSPLAAVWCKTGQGPVSLPARGKATFEASLPADGWDEARVGLRWYPAADRTGRPETAWSPAIARQDLLPRP